MNCLDSMAALYAQDLRFGDKLVAPMRLCNMAWYEMSRPYVFGLDLALRIAAFVPLIIATIASAFLCVIGFALKICFTPPALDRFKHFSILDDAPTQLYLPDNSEREISPESAQLFSTFNQDCINYVLTFLSFRDKRRFLQISQHFKKVIEESPTWDLYCEGIGNPVMPRFQRGIDLFDNNIDQLRWVFTPAFETLYKPLAKCAKFSLIKELPTEAIRVATIKYYDPYEGFFWDILKREFNRLVSGKYSNNVCFRVVLTSPDGSMGEGIAFHDVSQDVEKRHFFVSYGDPNEVPIYTSYWKGQNFEEAHYKEKYLIRQFKAYADNGAIDLSLSEEMSSGEDISSQESSDLEDLDEVKSMADNAEEMVTQGLSKWMSEEESSEL